jgi:hypothetical protein
MKSIDPCTACMDLVHDTVNPVYVFSFRKIIQKIRENSQIWRFCTKTPQFYFIYVLVPKIYRNNF